MRSTLASHVRLGLTREFRLAPGYALAMLLTICVSAQTSVGWVQLHPRTSPPPRTGFALAYDSTHGQVVLFGGGGNVTTTCSGACPPFLNDTWIWDGSNWTQKMPPFSPAPRVSVQAAYDTAHGQVVLFGGTGNDGIPRNDTWVWDGTNWTQKFPQTSPPARANFAMTYDAGHGQVVISGGRTSFGDLNDTWVWDGFNWTQKFPQMLPFPRGGAQMVYDSARNLVMLFGGLAAASLTYYNDTWTWDGNTWTLRLPASIPAPRWAFAMAYDAGHSRAVLFGGALSNSVYTFANDTWMWDGSDWQQQFSSVSPAARSTGMVYDSAHEQIVLFGGHAPPPANTVFADTWVWSGGPLLQANIVAVSGDGQSGPAGTPLPKPVQVAVSDTLGNPVPGATVNFAGSNASVSQASVQTDTSGRAAAVVTLGNTVGPAHITATSGKLPPVTFNFTVLSPQPAISQGGVVPIFSSSPVIQPGSWISIYGQNLVTGAPATWNGDFPTMLGGTSVTIDNRPGYLWYASAGQINLQAPDDTVTGPVNVTVTNAWGTATATVTLAPASPSFNLLDTSHVAGIIVRSDGSGQYGGGTYDIIGPAGTSLGYPTVPAKAGDNVVLFGTGFGPTNPSVPAGAPFSGATPAVDDVQLQINGMRVTPAFVGMSAAGQFQLNLVIPVGLGTGDLPLVAAVNGVQTPSNVVISIQ